MCFDSRRKMKIIALPLIGIYRSYQRIHKDKFKENYFCFFFQTEKIHVVFFLFYFVSTEYKKQKGKITKKKNLRITNISIRGIFLIYICFFFHLNKADVLKIKKKTYFGETIHAYLEYVYCGCHVFSHER